MTIFWLLTAMRVAVEETAMSVFLMLQLALNAHFRSEKYNFAVAHLNKKELLQNNAEYNTCQIVLLYCAQSVQ